MNFTGVKGDCMAFYKLNSSILLANSVASEIRRDLWNKSYNNTQCKCLENYTEVLMGILSNTATRKLLNFFNDMQIIELFNILHTYYIYVTTTLPSIKLLKLQKRSFKFMVFLLKKLSISCGSDTVSHIVEHMALSAKLWNSLVKAEADEYSPQLVTESTYILIKLSKILSEKSFSELIFQNCMSQVLKSLIPTLFEIISLQNNHIARVARIPHQTVINGIRNLFCYGLFSPSMIIDICSNQNENKANIAKNAKSSNRSKFAEEFYEAVVANYFCESHSDENSIPITLIDFLFRSYLCGCERLTVRPLGKRSSLSSPLSGDKQSLYYVLKFVSSLWERLQCLSACNFPMVARITERTLQLLTATYGFDGIRNLECEDIVKSVQRFDQFIIKTRQELTESVSSILLSDQNSLSQYMLLCVSLNHCDNIKFLLCGMFFTETDANNSAMTCFNVDKNMHDMQWQMLDRFHEICGISLADFYYAAHSMGVFQEYASLIEFVKTWLNCDKPLDLQNMMVQCLLFFHGRYNLLRNILDRMSSTRSLDKLFTLLKSSWVCENTIVSPDTCCFFCDQRTVQFLSNSLINIPSSQLKLIWKNMICDFDINKNSIFHIVLISVLLQIENRAKFTSISLPSHNKYLSSVLEDMTMIFSSFSIEMVVSSQTIIDEQKYKLFESFLLFTGQIFNFLSKHLCKLDTEDFKFAKCCDRLKSHFSPVISFPIQLAPIQLSPLFMMTKLKILLSIYILNMHLSIQTFSSEYLKWVNTVTLDFQCFDHIDEKKCVEFLSLFISNINSLETLISVINSEVFRDSIYRILLRGITSFLKLFVGISNNCDYELSNLIICIKNSFISPTVNDSSLIRLALRDAILKYHNELLGDLTNAEKLRNLGKFYSVLTHNFNATVLNSLGEDFMRKILHYLNLSKEFDDLLFYNIDGLCILGWNFYSLKAQDNNVVLLQQLFHIVGMIKECAIKSNSCSNMLGKIDGVLQLIVGSFVFEANQQSFVLSSPSDEFFSVMTLQSLIRLVDNDNGDERLLMFLMERLIQECDIVDFSLLKEKMSIVLALANSLRSKINGCKRLQYIGLLSCFKKKFERFVKSLRDGNKKAFYAFVGILGLNTVEYLEQHHKLRMNANLRSFEVFLQLFTSSSICYGNVAVRHSPTFNALDNFELFVFKNISFSRLLFERNVLLLTSHNCCNWSVESRNLNCSNYGLQFLFMMQLQNLSQSDSVIPYLPKLLGWHYKYVKSFVSNNDYRFLAVFTQWCSNSLSSKFSTSHQNVNRVIIQPEVGKHNAEALILTTDILELIYMEKKSNIIASVLYTIVLKFDCLLAASRGSMKIMLKKFALIVKLVSKFYCFLMYVLSRTLELTDDLVRELKRSIQLISRIFTIYSPATSLRRYLQYLIISTLKDNAQTKFNLEMEPARTEMDSTLMHGMYCVLEKMKSHEKESTMKMLDSVEQMILSDLNEEMVRSSKFEGN